MQNRCAELKLDAERKAGELLGELPKKANQHVAGDTLSQAGIERHQSSRWQRIASIPEPEYEAYKAEAYNGDERPVYAPHSPANRPAAP
jgi:hypothetical protein